MFGHTLSPAMFPSQLNTHSPVQMKLVANPLANGHIAASMLHKGTKEKAKRKKKGGIE